MNGLEAAQIRLSGAEHPHAPAEQHRRDVEHELIDQPRGERLLGNADPAGQQDILGRSRSRDLYTASAGSAEEVAGELLPGQAGALGEAAVHHRVRAERADLDLGERGRDGAQ